MEKAVILNVDLDILDIMSIIRGAERSGDERMFRKFIDDWYYKLSDEVRVQIFDFAVKEVYSKMFSANPLLRRMDKLFLARYNPNTQVEIEYIDDKKEKHVTTAFTSEGNYYISSYETIPKCYIIKTEYL